MRGLNLVEAMLIITVVVILALIAVPNLVRVLGG